MTRDKELQSRSKLILYSASFPLLQNKSNGYISLMDKSSMTLKAFQAQFDHIIGIRGINMTEFKEEPKAQAGVLNQAIRRPHGTSLRLSIEGKITSLLIRLKGSGLARARAVRYIKAYTSKQRCSVSSAFDCGLRCHAQIHADPIPHRKTSRGNTDNLLLDIQILQKNTTALYVY